MTTKISIKEKIGYSLGDTASNLFFQTSMLFLMYFYTDVVGIAAGMVGTMFLVTRVWDAVFDPIIGLLADRTNTRWGKFRPYLMWMALPFGIAMVLTFTAPHFSPLGKLIYAYITSTLMWTVYSTINVPYSALMGVITPNSMERTVISSYRFVAAFLGGLIVQSSVMWMVKKFGVGHEASGWQVAMIALSALAVVLFLITFGTTRERVLPPAAQKTSLRQDLKDLFANQPWVMIALATVMQLTMIAMRNGSIMYYFKYYVQDQPLTLFGKTSLFSYQTLVSSFMLIGSLVTIAGAVLTRWFTQWFGKRACYIGFMLMTAVFTAALFFLKPDQVLLMYVFQILASFSMGPLAVLQWSIYTDTADFGEWKNHRRATGLVMSASLFALKLGLMLGGALQGWLMSGYGFIANEVQTLGSLTGIRLVISLYPAIGALVAAAFMLFYPLNNQKMEQIERDLSARRSAV
jgi:glycoside/pentoside/hexuronide:cation symporter, GPH family